MKKILPTDSRHVNEIIGSIVVIGIIGAILLYFIPGLIRWIIEVLGYPFWVVFTKFCKIDINQFDAFWAFLGIVCLAMVVVGSFTPVQISQQITTISKKEEETESGISPLRGRYESASFLLKLLSFDLNPVHLQVEGEIICKLVDDSICLSVEKK